MTIKLPNGEVKKIKYLAEGKYNYVFKVHRDSRLLKILRDQFYNLNNFTGENETKENCRIMNNLASSGLSVNCEHITGGACFVQDAGTILKYHHLSDRNQLVELFKKIYEWSLINKIVFLDYNENNWCYINDHISMIDVDINLTCKLDDIKKNKYVLSRFNAVNYKSNEEALWGLLKKEEELLYNTLRTTK